MQKYKVLDQSDTPQLKAELPVGTHVLEVVVEDSAGMESDPVTIIVVVEPDTGEGPVIDDFAPKSLRAGDTVDPFVIKGWRLRGENETDQVFVKNTKVEFLFVDKDEHDESIGCTLKPGSTADTLELIVEIGDVVAEDNRRLRVTTLYGAKLADKLLHISPQ